MPGLISPFKFDNLSLYLLTKALAKVLFLFPAPGCTTKPLGLFIIKYLRPQKLFLI